MIMGEMYKSIEKIGGLSFCFRQLSLEEVASLAGPLRFQVYCYECGFIREEDYPDQTELDDWDDISVHFGAFAGDFLIGYMRLIPMFSVKLAAPIERHVPEDLKIRLMEENAVEISRLVISKGFRQRQGDALYYEVDSYLDNHPNKDNRRYRPMVFGLYKAAYKYSKANSINWWTALMEKSLEKLLSKTGVRFTQVGGPVECMGTVYPYVLYLPEAEKTVLETAPAFYEYFKS